METACLAPAFSIGWHLDMGSRSSSIVAFVRERADLMDMPG